MSGCTWPLAGRLAGRTCGRDLVSPRSSFCAAHHNLNRETTMGRLLLMSGDVTSRKCTGPELVGGVLS